MTSKVKPIPDGYHTVTPYIIVKNAANAIKFYEKAFGATKLMSFEDPSGKVSHAEIKIGNSPIMISDEFLEMDTRSPQSYGGSPITLHLYVENVDTFVSRATTAGAKVLKPIQDQPYGDRSGSLTDPYGHVWHISTHKEDVSHEEVKKRYEKMMKQK